MTQIESSKLVEYILIGVQDEDSVQTSKLVMYVVAYPGNGDEPTTWNSGFAQKIRRR